MTALYAGPNGKAWEDSRVKIYGWFEGSLNLSTSHQSNLPSAYDIYSNRVELDQAVLYIERLPDTVQTTSVDWGFHLSGLYGSSYRFTLNKGYFSQQLLDSMAYDTVAPKRDRGARHRRLLAEILAPYVEMAAMNVDR